MSAASGRADVGQRIRLFLKILAVITGLIGGWFAIAGAVLFFGALLVFAKEGAPFVHGEKALYLALFALIPVFLGGLMASRAWWHLRRPDRGTAGDIIGIATYVLGLTLLRLLKGETFKPIFPGPYGPTLELLLIVSVLVGCYVLYRMWTKRIAIRAFQEEA